ncbi:sulfatase family protein [Catenovulum sediminis]|uniref:Sulfatase-like hydrolase/transferase n=1 Tax=Catenovulum sediminis TaxID=1740262 RepID=A0ABV1RFS4_9ALTE
MKRKILFSVSSICLLFASISVHATNQPPNIVVLFSDDAGFHHISHYGGEVPTPNIDAIGQNGVTFNQAIAPAAVCTPSRYSLMTGLYAGRNKSAEFLAENPLDQPYNIAWNTFLTGKDTTMHQVMSQHGYYTGFVGKWHITDHLTMDVPHLKGDEDLDSEVTDNLLKHHQNKLAEHIKAMTKSDFVANVIAANNEEVPIDKLKVHNPEWITQGAMEFLDTVKGEKKPFFLLVASTNPHGPSAQKSLDMSPHYTPEGRIFAPTKYHPKRETIVERLKDAGLPVNHKTVSSVFLDDQVAAVQTKLKEIGEADNTVIIYLSDHNSEPGKATTYDAGVRIPMLVSWPGKITPGTINENVVQVTDVFPTALDIANINHKLNLDGRSILPAILQNQPMRDDVYLEMGWTRAVRTDRFKYIAFRYPASVIQAMKSKNLSEAPNHLNIPTQGQPNVTMLHYPHYFDPDQLYDLHKDPKEQHNLANDPAYANVMANMKARLAKYLARFEHPYDLEDTKFMKSEFFQSLSYKTLSKAEDRLPKWAKHVQWRIAPEHVK